MADVPHGSVHGIAVVAATAALAGDLAAVDRDVALAVGGEGLAVPATPPISEPEAGQPGHQIELCRPSQASPDGSEVRPGGVESHVVLVEDLGERVVGADVEFNRGWGDVLDRDVAVGRGPRGGYRSLDQEHAVGVEMAGG